METPVPIYFFQTCIVLFLMHSAVFSITFTLDFVRITDTTIILKSIRYFSTSPESHLLYEIILADCATWERSVCVCVSLCLFLICTLCLIQCVYQSLMPISCCFNLVFLCFLYFVELIV
jgi:hypothetical protein